jgi:hypothetical protein
MSKYENFRFSREKAMFLLIDCSSLVAGDGNINKVKVLLLTSSVVL